MRRITRHSLLSSTALIVALLVMLAALQTDLAFSQEPDDTPIGTFTQGRTMATSRGFHTATPLKDGRVLLTGGGDGVTVLASAETFDPDSDRLALTGPMGLGRLNHKATLLNSGDVLVAGGDNGDVIFYDSAEIYDSRAGTFTAIGNMIAGRSSHTSTQLLDERVLVAGGLGDKFVSLRNAEFYSPASSTFHPTDDMTIARSHHTSTLMPDGRVVVIGGFGSVGALTSIEVYDPASDEFAAAGNLNVPRGGHTTTLLASGLLLVAGGANHAQESAGETPLGEIDLFDVNTGLSRVVEQRMIPRTAHTASMLPDGRVLITGGIGPGEAVVGLAQVFDPSDESVTMTDLMFQPRAFHTANSLVDGRVLIAGGVAAGNVFVSASEFFKVSEVPAPPDSVVEGPMLTPDSIAVPPTEPKLVDEAPGHDERGGACSGQADGILVGLLGTLMIPAGLVAVRQVKQRR